MKTLKKKNQKLPFVVACALVTALVLSACGSDNPTGNAVPGSPNALSGSGSSVQKAVMDLWRSGFSEQNNSAYVQYAPDGSGAGRSALLSGAVQFAASDSYLSSEEIEKSRKQCGPGGAIDLPVYVSPIVVFFNVPGVEELNLRPGVVTRIFRGEIVTWDDPQIAADNKGVDLPQQKINPVHRNDGSGTTHNFTDYLAANVPEVWGEKPSHTWPESVRGESAKGTSGVVTTTSGTSGAISYADKSEIPPGLGMAKLGVGEEFVAASEEATAAAVAASPLVASRDAHDVAVAVERRSADPGMYPLAFISYHLLCSSYKDQETVDLVKDFARYVVSPSSQRDAAEVVRSVPLPAGLTEHVREAISSVKVMP